MNYNKVEFYCSYGTYEQLPPSERPEIVFAGHSNVGKSSLINKLFNRKNLARVSSTPGKTATINFFSGDNFYFVDLPGYGYAKVSKEEQLKWAALIEGYLAQPRDIRIIFMLLDIRHAPGADDIHMINFLIDQQFPFAVVLTKADKLNKTQYARRMEEIKTEVPCADQITMIPFSSVNGQGIGEIKAIIDEIQVDSE